MKLARDVPTLNSPIIQSRNLQVAGCARARRGPRPLQPPDLKPVRILPGLGREDRLFFHLSEYERRKLPQVATDHAGRIRRATAHRFLRSIARDTPQVGDTVQQAM